MTFNAKVNGFKDHIFSFYTKKEPDHFSPGPGSSLSFVLFFYLGIRGTGPANLVLFAVIEFAKIVLTIGCVCLVFLAYKDINWIAFAVSFVISFKSYIFLLSKLKS